MKLPRVLTIVLLGGLGCLLAVGLSVRTPAPDPLPAVAEAAPEPLAVLGDWDRRRALAWRRGSPNHLDQLYVAESPAGRADRRLLGAYLARGLRVSGLQVQRAAVTVVAAEADRLVLLVTDRMVGATAVGDDVRLRLPRDRWSRWRLELRRVEGDWRMARVAPRSQASPAASTEVTSRSRNW